MFLMNRVLGCIKVITLNLIDSLKNLRDLGNTVIVVEHDRETIESSDFMIDLGPGAGEHGGKVCLHGFTGSSWDLTKRI